MSLRSRMSKSHSSSSLEPPQDSRMQVKTRMVGPRRQKRLRNSDEKPSLSAESAEWKEPPAKRTRRSFSPNSLPLTIENLRKHTIITSKQSMTGGSIRSSKRTASVPENEDSIASQSVGYQETVTQTSQKSASTAAQYRHSILRRAKISFQFEAVPEDISTAVDNVLKREIPSERQEQLFLIASALHEAFVLELSIPAREDDYIEPLYHALLSLGHGNLAMRRKASILPLSYPCLYSTRANFTFRLGD